MKTRKEKAYFRISLCQKDPAAQKLTCFTLNNRSLSFAVLAGQTCLAPHTSHVLLL